MHNKSRSLASTNNVGGGGSPGRGDGERGGGLNPWNPSMEVICMGMHACFSGHLISKHSDTGYHYNFTILTWPMHQSRSIPSIS